MFTLLQASTEVVAQEVVATQELNFSLWSMAVKGGWLMLVLLALSIVAIYIFGQKWWAIRKAANIDKNFMNEIRNLIHEGKINAALEMCKNDNSPIARLVEKGIASGCGTDAPGSYIAWLCTQVPVHAMEMPGRRYDIGNLESYEAVQKEYRGIC